MKIREKIDLSEMAGGEIDELMAFTLNTLTDVIEMLTTEDMALCQRVLDEEDEIDRMTRTLKDAHMQRLNKGTCQAYGGVVFLDLLSNLERVGDHAANIAQDIMSMQNERKINKIEEVIY